MKLRIRVMDTDNGGIEWSASQTVEINPPDGEDPNEIARRINKAQYEVISDTELGKDDQAPGTLIRATGDLSSGIAWFDDRGHQGATDILFEWHSFARR